MTKFEEEVKRPDNTGIDPFSKRDVDFSKLAEKFGRGAQTLKSWRNYADYKEKEGEQKDEEIQELRKHCEKLENENSFLRDKNTTFDSNGNSVEPIIQQQALPVVPECVAKTVELLKKNPESSWSKLCDSLGEEGVTWLNEFQHKDERFGFGGLNSKLFVLFHLAINGYTVEKP